MSRGSGERDGAREGENSSDTHHSIISFGNWSKPADTLIRKVSAAVGLVYEPLHMARKARAAVQVAKIEAAGRIELVDIEQRALARLTNNEIRKQKNIESITVQAAKHVPDNAETEDLSEDWLAHFFDKCAAVSDQKMQSLWARLLAGEAVKPDTYSKRTVTFLSTMDQREVKMFSSLGRFCWKLKDVPYLFIYDLDGSAARQVGISSYEIQLLERLGLIFKQAYKLIHDSPEIEMIYENRVVKLSITDGGDRDFDLGVVTFTPLGEELARLFKKEFDEDYFLETLEKWIDSNHTPYSPLPRQEKQADWSDKPDVP